MLNVEKKRTYEATAWEVWHLIGDFYDTRAWMPGITSIHADHDNRTRSVLAGTSTDPVLEQLVDEGHWFQQYRILSGPLPVQDYTADFHVIELDPGHARVTWSAVFNAKAGATNEQATDTVNRVFTGGLDQIAIALRDRKNAQPPADLLPADELSPAERDGLFEPILQALTADGAEERFMFGQRGLVARGHLFATMFHASFVARLNAGTPEYNEALDLPGSTVWNPTHGKKPFEDWVQIPVQYSDAWLGYARTALERAGVRHR